MIIENFPAYLACFIRLNLAPIKRARTKPAAFLNSTAASLWESDFSLYSPSLPLHLMLKFHFYVLDQLRCIIYLQCTSNIVPDTSYILPSSSNILQWWLTCPLDQPGSERKLCWSYFITYQSWSLQEDIRMFNLSLSKLNKILCDN